MPIEIERHVRDAQTISNMVNNFSFNPAMVCAELTRDHRTIQQTITRFCVEWLRTCASDSYRTDGRNEASKAVAKYLLEDKNPDKLYLPYI